MAILTKVTIITRVLNILTKMITEVDTMIPRSWVVLLSPDVAISLQPPALWGPTGQSLLKIVISITIIIIIIININIIITIVTRILAATSPASVTIDGVVKLRMEEEGMGARAPISCYSTIRWVIIMFHIVIQSSMDNLTRRNVVLHLCHRDNEMIIIRNTVDKFPGKLAWVDHMQRKWT